MLKKNAYDNLFIDSNDDYSKNSIAAHLYISSTEVCKSYANA